MNAEGGSDGTENATVDVVVDVANVMGSRPDGWWRDRAGAAARLVRSVSALAGATVVAPDGRPVRIRRLVAVVEGQARGIAGVDGAELVRAPADGDTSVVRICAEAVATGREVIAVTADRGLRARLAAGTIVAGPRWLLDLITRR